MCSDVTEMAKGFLEAAGRILLKSHLCSSPSPYQLQTCLYKPRPLYTGASGKISLEERILLILPLSWFMLPPPLIQKSSAVSVTDIILRTETIECIGNLWTSNLRFRWPGNSNIGRVSPSLFGFRSVLIQELE